DHPAELRQEPGLVSIEIPRLRVDQAQRAEPQPGVVMERAASVETCKRRPLDEGVVCEVRVCLKISDEEDAVLDRGVNAEGVAPRRLLDVEPLPRLEPLPVLLEEGDHADRAIEEKSSEPDDGIEVRPGRCANDAQHLKGMQASLLIP